MQYKQVGTIWEPISEPQGDGDEWQTIFGAVVAFILVLCVVRGCG